MIDFPSLKARVAVAVDFNEEEREFLLIAINGQELEGFIKEALDRICEPAPTLQDVADAMKPQRLVQQISELKAERDAILNAVEGHLRRGGERNGQHSGQHNCRAVIGEK